MQLQKRKRPSGLCSDVLKLCAAHFRVSFPIFNTFLSNFDGVLCDKIIISQKNHFIAQHFERLKVTVQYTVQNGLFALAHL